MTFIHTRWLASAACFAFLVCVSVSGCSDDAGPGDGTGGTAGTAGAAGGTGGMGGMGGVGGTEPPQLWEGQSNGVDVRFCVSGDGLTLTTEPACRLGQGGQATAPSFEIDVRLAGTNQIGQPCSFELRYERDISIDQETKSFRGSVVEPPGSDIRLSFSGELVGQMASGIAQREQGDSSCRVGWAASTSNRCDEAAIETCLDLQECCRAILINPVFFETCNSVVLQCDESRCQDVLDGYPQCAPEPDP